MAHVQLWPDFSAIPTAKLAQSKLKDTDFAVYEDIPKELYDMRKAQLKKFKAAKKAFFSKAQPDRLFINGKFIPINQPFS